MSTPEYGPSGYLPPKAAKRARKIILREQMGWQWPLAAGFAALIVVVAGVFFLRGFNRPPAEPFIPLGSITQVPPGEAMVVDGPEDAAVIVRVGGDVRAFEAQHATTIWCAESQRLESPDSVWRLDGTRTYGAGESLRPLGARVFDGVVYVDFSASLPAPAAAPDGGPPRCLAMG